MSTQFIRFVPFTTQYHFRNTVAKLDTLAVKLVPRRDEGNHFVLNLVCCPAELKKDPLIGYKRDEKVMHEMMRLTNLKPDFFYVTTLVQ